MSPTSYRTAPPRVGDVHATAGIGRWQPAPSLRVARIGSGLPERRRMFRSVAGENRAGVLDDGGDLHVREIVTPGGHAVAAVGDQGDLIGGVGIALDDP